MTKWCVLLILLAGRVLASETMVYSFHVGINDPPARSDLSALRYADDDAARFYLFSQDFVHRSVLATILDADSQKRFPGLATQCVAPTTTWIEQELATFAAEMKQMRAAGKQVVLYFSYSGHGVNVGDHTELTMLDKTVDRVWLEDQILKMPADVIHLFVDACHAQDLVSPRGRIEGEASANSRPLSDRERERLFRDDLLSRYPHVGALVAASTDREAHEWSYLQSGVFSHELLSALAGAADVNLDGQIAYSEVAAFISAANHTMTDPNAVLEVVALPPRIDRNTPILRRDWMHQPATLDGATVALGHFYLETENGLRIVDAHPEDRHPLSVWVPSGQKIWVRTSDLEASFESRPGTSTSFASLQFQQAHDMASRGSISHSLKKGFFASPFGRSYYQGWVDRRDEVSVEFGQLPLIKETVPQQSPKISLWCLGGSGVALAATALFGALAWEARQDYEGTNLQKQALDAKSRLDRYTGLAIGSGVGAAGLAVAAWLLWPDQTWSVTPTSNGQTMGLTFNLSW